LKPIFLLIIRTAVYSLMMLGILEVMRIDSQSLDFNESSITEILQQTFLVIGFVVSFWLAKKKKFLNWFFISLGTLLLVIFIREYNNFLDNYVFKGLWETLVYSILGIYLFFLVKNFKPFIDQLNAVANHYSIGVFLVGFIIVMVFSRIYGLDEIWVNILGDNFIRPIKRISEEGTELLGYSLMLLGVFEMTTIKKSQLNT